MTTPQQLTRATMIGPFPLPEIDDELRADARAKPGEWIAFIDPAINPEVPTGDSDHELTESRGG